jgi:hypothetical protein
MKEEIMKLFKFTIIVSAFVLISAVAWAGNSPDYDAVGRDLDNFYADNIIYYTVVTAQKFDLEFYSDFRDFYLPAHKNIPLEGFSTNAGQLKENPCFEFGPDVALTDVWNEGTYEWWIVLQMKPESDINLNIYDCVLKHNETDLWFYAEQTGRYRMPWGELMFEGNNVGNPLVYAEAYPGEYATTQFHQWHSLSGEGMILDARTLPGLVRVPLDGVTYTSKAHWPEGIVMALPKTGNFNESGDPEFNLKGGDVIYVKIEIPPDSNSADVWYGPQSVILKYIGIVNTEYFSNGPES